MKKGFRLCAVVLSVLLFAATFVGCDNTGNEGDDGSKVIEGQTFTVESPDKTIKAEAVLDKAGSLYYRVFKGSVPIVEYSALGFTFAEEDLSSGLAFEKKEDKVISLSYNNISGKSSKVECKANETKLTLRGARFYLDVTLRAYDDGYAFRYGIRDADGGSGTVTVSEENSQFALPTGSRVWMQAYRANPADTNCFSYEDAYKRFKSDSLGGKTVSMPMLYKAGASDYWSLITESELIGSGYYGSFLKEVASEPGSGKLQTVPSPAGVQQDNNVIAYPFTSPWRLGITGTLATVVESELTEKLYDDVEYWKPDDYDSLSAEEKKTYDYDWVEPGTGAWSWLQYYKKQNNWTMQNEYLDFAGEMGWKYLILDGGWKDGLNETNFKNFTARAHEKGVKIIVWCNGLEDFGGGDKNVLVNTLKKWKSLGVDGIKPDFFDGCAAGTHPKHQGEDANTIAWYETLYQETAKLQMVVNCHGSNKPTGERRKYPHVLTREAICGEESYKTSGALNVNAMFTRGVVGPTDFTPLVKTGGTIDGWVNNSNTTMGQQMALALLYETGMSSMAGTIEQYRDAQINAFYKALPAARDETRFIGGEPDDYYCAAIKAGDAWFVAGINADGEREIEFDYAFLGDGDYTAEIFTDGENRDTVNKTDKTVTKSSSEKIKMESNGGFAVRLVKN